MALITCPECLKDISDKSTACIHCGCPVEKNTNPNSKMTLYPGTIRCPVCDFVYPMELSKCRCCNAINEQKPVIEKEKVSSHSNIEPDTAIICPKCKARNAYNADNKGFGLGKAAVGGILIGPVGLLGGLIGSKKTVITCLKCNYKWTP